MENSEVETILTSLTHENVLRLPPELIEDYIRSLRDVFTGELTSVESYVYVAQVLDTQNGLPKHISLRSRADNSSYGAPLTKDAFDLLQYIIENYPEASAIPGAKLLPWCVNFLHGNASNNVKSYVLRIARVLTSNCPSLNADFSKILSIVREYLSTETKIPPTLKNSILALVGAIFETNPGPSDPYFPYFLMDIVKSVKSFNSAKNTQDSLLDGYLKLLDGVLVHFKIPSPNDGDLIYKMLEETCPIRDRKRNTVPLTALNLFIRHAEHFQLPICKNYVSWHQKLSSWIIPSEKSEHKQLGVRALTKYYSTLFKFLDESTPDDFLEYSNDLLKKNLKSLSYLDIYRVKDLLTAFSELAPLYLKFSTEEELVKDFENIMTGAEVISRCEDNRSLIGLRLEAESKVMSLVKCRYESSALKKVMIDLIEYFPNIDGNFQMYALDSLESSLLAWIRNEMFDFGSIAYQGLLRSCSHPILVDVEYVKGSEVENQEKLLSYKDFVTIWVRLLTISSRAKGEAVTKSIGKILYKSVLEKVMEIAFRLDLDLKVTTHERSDPSTSMEPKNPDDFRIFVNLVDLFQEVIPKSDTFHFQSQVEEIIREVVAFGSKNSLVSGFNKVLSVCLRYADDPLSPETILLLKGFVIDLVERLVSQKDDLLISSLKVILLCPKPIISDMGNDLEKVVISACRVGRGYSDLLELLIEALNNWFKYLPKERFEKIVRSTLRDLASILLGSGRKDVVQNVNVDRRSLKSKGKIRKKVISTKDRKLLGLQKGFLIFLGKLETKLVMESLEPASSENTSQHGILVCKLPQRDAPLSFCLNNLLPHVIELSLYSADRLVRVNACELLHSIILISIESSRRTRNNLIVFQELIDTCLVLSCDSDDLIKRMFDPLLIQITHYYSSKIQLMSGESAKVVESLFNGVAHEFDFAIRDQSARCLREFVEWSIKQTTPDAVSGSPYNLQAILKIVCDYAIHPDRCKRIGASVAFNRLYSVVREEEEILDGFWFRLYYYFSTSLEMCRNEDDARVIVAALEHLQRPFLERRQLFEKDSLERWIPPGFIQAKYHDLTLNVLKHCKSSSFFLRRSSQMFLKKLITTRSGMTLKEFVVTHINLNEDWKRSGNNFEKGIGIADFLVWITNEKVDLLKELDIRNVILQECAKWLNRALGHLDLLIILQFLRVNVSILPENVARTFLGWLSSQESLKPSEESEIVSIMRTLKDSNMQDIQLYLPSFSEDCIFKSLNACNSGSQTYFEILYLMNEANALLDTHGDHQLLDKVFQSLFELRNDREVAADLPVPFSNKLKITLKVLLKNNVSVESLVKLVSDESCVLVDNFKRTRGNYFLNYFKADLVLYFVRNFSCLDYFKAMGDRGVDCVQMIMKGFHDDFSKEAYQFVHTIMNDWEGWLKCSSDGEKKLNVYLKMLKTICSMQKTQHGTFIIYPYVVDWFFKLPVEVKLHNDDVIAITELLPQFSNYYVHNDPQCYNFLTNLDKRYLHLQRGMNDKSLWTKTNLENLISCMVTTGNLVVFDYVVMANACNPSLFTTETLEPAFQNFCIKAPASHILKALINLSKIIFHDMVEKQQIFSVIQVLNSIVKYCKKETVVAFFEGDIGKLVEVIKNKKDERLERDLSRKIAVIDIFRLFYEKSTKEDREKLHASFKPILLEACDQKKYHLERPTKENLELLRLYYCSRLKFLAVYATNFPREQLFIIQLFIICL